MAWRQLLHDVGITVLLAIIGVVITGILVIKNVKGNILWGILITWLLGIICQFTGLYVPNPDVGCLQPAARFQQRTFYSKSCTDLWQTPDFDGIFITETLQWLSLHSCL